MGLPRNMNLITNRTAKMPGDWKQQPTVAPTQTPAAHGKSKRRKARERFAEPLPRLSAIETARQRALFDRHEEASWTIRLPLSPTINSYRAVLHGRLVTSAEGREYHAAVKRLWIAHWKGWPPESLTGRLRLLVGIAFATKPPPDLDNRVKPLQDALVAAGVMENDNQVDDLRVIRLPLVKKPGYIDVTIETIG